MRIGWGVLTVLLQGWEVGGWRGPAGSDSVTVDLQQVGAAAAAPVLSCCLPPPPTFL